MSTSKDATPSNFPSDLSHLAEPAIRLYLDLLKRSLTNTLFETEPDADQKNELLFAHGFINHYIKSSAVSMLSLKRLDTLQSCIEDVLASDIDADLLEAGGCRGAATLF